MLIFGFPLVFLEFYLNKFRYLDFAVLQLVAMVALAYILYLLNLYGGADAKAIMVLSALFPIYPHFNGYPILKIGFIFAFSVLSNSVIVAPILAIIMFIRNIIKERFKISGSILYYFIGYRVDIDSIPKFHNLLEYFDENGNLIRVKRAVEPNDEIISRLKYFAKEKNVKKIWVTPALPFILFITAGYIVAFFIGDILLFILSLIL